MSSETQQKRKLPNTSKHPSKRRKLDDADNDYLPDWDDDIYSSDDDDDGDDDLSASDDEILIVENSNNKKSRHKKKRKKIKKRKKSKKYRSSSSSEQEDEEEEERKIDNQYIEKYYNEYCQTNDELDDYNIDSMFLFELKSNCKYRGLKVGGTSSALKQRLKDYLQQPNKPTFINDNEQKYIISDDKLKNEEEIINSMKLKALKLNLKHRHLAVFGIKPILENRLKEYIMNKYKKDDINFTLKTAPEGKRSCDECGIWGSAGVKIPYTECQEWCDLTLCTNCCDIKLLKSCDYQYHVGCLEQENFYFCDICDMDCGEDSDHDCGWNTRCHRECRNILCDQCAKQFIKTCRHCGTNYCSFKATIYYARKGCYSMHECKEK